MRVRVHVQLIIPTPILFAEPSIPKLIVLNVFTSKSSSAEVEEYNRGGKLKELSLTVHFPLSRASMSIIIVVNSCFKSREYKTIHN